MVIAESERESTANFDDEGTRRGWLGNAIVAVLVVAVAALGWITVDARKRASIVEARATRLENRAAELEAQVEGVDTETIASRVDDVERSVSRVEDSVSSVERSVSDLEGTSYGFVSVSDIDARLEKLRSCVNAGWTELTFSSGGYLYIARC